MNAPHRRRGWCPGALRPMMSGDGLLIRLRLSGGVVPAPLLSALADLSRRHGNGFFDLSQRGNLQIRGVREETWPHLLEALRSFIPFDRDADHEAVRNIIAPPLAGMDESALLPGLTLVRALEARLADTPKLLHLPDKFCFLIDDGGRIGLDAIAADIRLIAHPEGVRLAIGGDGVTAVPVADVAMDRAIDAAVALTEAFLALAPAHEARRMASLLAALGPSPIARAAGLDPSARFPSLPPRVTEKRILLGAQPGFIGVAPPFGRLTAAQMDLLAADAKGEARLTPFRVLLLPGAHLSALPALEKGGFIVDALDPRLAVVTCPGAPACHAGEVDTLTAAATLAPLFKGKGGNITLHLSGCAKGCAQAGAAPLVLTGEKGRFNLITNGRADALPLRHALRLKEAQGTIATLLEKKEYPA